jgi:hypothetical protein
MKVEITLGDKNASLYYLNFSINLFLVLHSLSGNSVN